MFGTPLIHLNFWQLRREADFRFSLMRLRENAESIAFYRGEAQERFPAQGAEGVEQLEAQLGQAFHEGEQRRGVHGRHAQEWVLGAIVFQADGELHDEAALGGEREQARERGVVEPVAVVIGMQPEAGHLVNFGAAADIFFPVGELRIHGAEGHEPAGVRAAFGGEASVRGGEVLVQQAVERAGPRLRDAVLAELGDRKSTRLNSSH